MICEVCDKKFELREDYPNGFKGICLPCALRLRLAAFTRTKKEREVILSMSDSEVQEFIRTAVRRLFDYFDLASKGMTNAMKEIRKTLDKLDREKKKK